MAKYFLNTYGVEIFVGTILTVFAMHCMESIRGEQAIGGEILILPMLMFLKFWFIQVKEDGLFDMFLFGGDDDEEDEEYDL